MALELPELQIGILQELDLRTVWASARLINKRWREVIEEYSATMMVGRLEIALHLCHFFGREICLGYKEYYDGKRQKFEMVCTSVKSAPARQRTLTGQRAEYYAQLYGIPELREIENQGFMNCNNTDPCQKLLVFKPLPCESTPSHRPAEFPLWEVKPTVCLKLFAAQSNLCGGISNLPFGCSSSSSGPGALDISAIKHFPCQRTLKLDPYLLQVEISRGIIEGTIIVKPIEAVVPLGEILASPVARVNLA